MPERSFSTETWDSDSWFQNLDSDQKLLFLYLWTNNHCNQAGLYHITLSTIAFDTKLSKEKLPELLNSLSSKVNWWQDIDLIWVKNFIKRQSKSPKFLQAVAKCLTRINNNGAVNELLSYNQERFSISIPYQYYMDKLSRLYQYSMDRITIPSDSSASADPITDSINKVVGDEKGGEGNVFLVYEQEIGQLTPSITEELKDAEREYATELVIDAIKEAVRAGKRNWRYVNGILENWRKESRFKLKDKEEHQEVDMYGGHQSLVRMIYVKLGRKLGREPTTICLARLGYKSDDKLIIIYNKLRDRLDEAVPAPTDST